MLSKTFLTLSVISISVSVAEWLFLKPYLLLSRISFWSRKHFRWSVYELIFLRFCWYLMLLIWVDNCCIPEDLFFYNGITLASFKGSGKNSLTKDLLTHLEIGILIFLEYFLRSLVTILFAPIYFLRFNLLMSSTSSDSFGVKKKFFFDGFTCDSLCSF